MKTGENDTKKAEFKNNHCSTMSNSAWYDLVSKGDISKLHDDSHNPKCNCQKQITLTPKQCKLERAGFKKTITFS